MGTLRYVCAPKGQQAGSDGVACVHSQTTHSSMQMREHPGPFSGQRQHARDELQSGAHQCNLHLIKSPPGSPHGPPHSHQEGAATSTHIPALPKLSLEGGHACAGHLRLLHGPGALPAAGRLGAGQRAAGGPPGCCEPCC